MAQNNRILLRILGLLTVIVGAAILTWIGYNIFVEWQPQARGNPFFSSLVSVLLINVGIIWVKGKTVQEEILSIPRPVIVIWTILALFYQFLG